jgi:hypothetical protein
MAERRMFAKTIIDSDAFLDMPLSSQALYFHLSMRADDDGFLNNPLKILRMVGGNQNDYDLLKAKNFIITFENGVIVIKHWKMHNYLRADRYKETVYLEEKSRLTLKENGAYSLNDDFGIPTVNQVVHRLDTQVRLGKDSIGKDSEYKKNNRFTPPTLDEVSYYCDERKNDVNPLKFINFYESKGWLIGKNKMKDWKAAVRTWESKEQSTNTKQIVSNEKIIDGVRYIGGIRVYE